MSKTVALIRFSSREAGNCAAISAFIADHYAAENVKEFVIDNQILQPCNNCNYECLQPGKSCPNLNKVQTEMMDNICSADLLYYIVPNYCGYPSANYFVFNERAVGYYKMNRALIQKYREIPKRFIIVSNSEGQNFVSAMQQQVYGEPEILYLKTSKYQKRSTAGDMMESEAAKADLKAFLECHPF